MLYHNELSDEKKYFYLKGANVLKQWEKRFLALNFYKSFAKDR